MKCGNFTRHRWRIPVVAAVVVMRTTPGLAVQLTQLTFGSTGPSYEAYQSEPAWSPNSAYLAYSSASWQTGGEPYFSIGIVASSGGSGPVFEPPVWIQVHPTWSRDGTQIAFAGGGGLVVAPLSNYHAFVPILLQGVQAPSWSPVEDRIVFESAGQLAVIPSIGGAPASLPTGGGHHPAWSPSGSRLAYDAGGQIWVLDLATLSSSPITTGATSDVHPTWSPDGGWIAFSSQRSGSRALWVVAAMGGAPVQLTTGGTSDFDPVWSPDGQRIAFTSERGGAGPHVWVASELPDFTVAVEKRSWSDIKAFYRP